MTASDLYKCTRPGCNGEKRIKTIYPPKCPICGGKMVKK